MANLKLTQYMVRLNFDDVEKPKKVQPAENAKSKDGKKDKKKKRPGFFDSDFDSEAEYASDNSQRGRDSEDEVEYVGNPNAEINF